MAQTIRTLTGTGSPTVYNVDFDLGYLRQSHIFVYTGDDHTLNNIAFTFINTAQIQVDVAVGEEFFLRRVVPRNVAINDYVDGAILREKNLDASFAQGLMIQEEISDGFVNVDELVNFKSNLDMDGNRIVNLGDPVDAQDALNKQTADAQIVVEQDRFNIEKGLRESRDIVQDNYNTQQDGRTTALEEAVPVVGAQYVANFNFTATGGETVLETNYTFSYAMLSINGIVQTIGMSFNILGSTFVLAGPIEQGDEVTAILTVPFVPSGTFTGTGDWLYTALGGETTVDVGLAFSSLILSINGLIQIPTRAFSVTGSILTFAEPLSEDDELYASLTAD